MCILRPESPPSIAFEAFEKYRFKVLSKTYFYLMATYAVLTHIMLSAAKITFKKIKIVT